MDDTALTIRRRSCWFAITALASCAWLVLAFGAHAAPPVYSVAASTPDFSQHSDITWSNFCAPTSGSDLAYFFAGSLLGLRQGHPLPPPNGPADAGADAIITEMAALMATTGTGGTTANGLVAGLDAYFELHDSSPTIHWDTRHHLYAGIPSAVDFAAWYADVTESLSTGSGVILLLQWPLGRPSPDYDEPDGLPDPDGPIGPDAPIGHAVVMTGYDELAAVPPSGAVFEIHDPANNSSTHLWPGDAGTTQPADLTLFGISGVFPELHFISGSPASVYGAVIITPVAAIPALPFAGAATLLLVMGTLGVLQLRRRNGAAARVQEPSN